MVFIVFVEEVVEAHHVHAQEVPDEEDTTPEAPKGSTAEAETRTLVANRTGHGLIRDQDRDRPRPLVANQEHPMPGQRAALLEITSRTAEVGVAAAAAATPPQS